MDEKENTKHNSFFSQLAWWSTDEKEIREQAEKYNSLGITKSARGIASLLILALAVLNIVFVLLNWASIETFFEAVIYLLLAFFVYKGNRFAIVSVMILWTIDKAIGLYSAGINHTTSGFSYLIILLWWTVFMRFFYGALKVENLRRKLKLVDKKRESTLKTIFYIIASVSLLLITLSAVYYVYYSTHKDEIEAQSCHQWLEMTGDTTYTFEGKTSVATGTEAKGLRQLFYNDCMKKIGK